jgi:hypothetical protein
MSFIEMMESGRGPGVIGTLMALLVVTIFALLFAFAFDERLQGGGQSIESYLASQTKEIEELGDSIKHGNSRLVKAQARQAQTAEWASAKRESQSRTAQIHSLESGISSAREAIDALQLEFDTYKDAYREIVRGKAKGETMERLETRDGQVYVDVTIRNVTPVGIQIMHDGGHKRIPYEVLPEPLINRFQFDQAQKAAAIAAEEQQRNQHEAAVSVAHASVAEQQDEKRKLEAEARRNALASGITIKQNRLSALRDEIRSLEEAIPRESLKRISRAPQMRLQLANKQRELSTMQADVARMQTELNR